MSKSILDKELGLSCIYSVVRGNITVATSLMAQWWWRGCAAAIVALASAHDDVYTAHYTRIDDAWCPTDINGGCAAHHPDFVPIDCDERTNQTTLYYASSAFDLGGGGEPTFCNFTTDICSCVNGTATESDDDTITCTGFDNSTDTAITELQNITSGKNPG